MTQLKPTQKQLRWVDIVARELKFGTDTHLISLIKERVQSEIIISQIYKGILVIVPIRFISFRLFLFFWMERLGAVHLWRQPLWGEGGSTKFWHFADTRWRGLPKVADTKLYFGWKKN